MKIDKQFVNTFEDIIQQHGAMDELISDNAQVEVSGKAKDFFCTYVIGNWLSEPHQHQQNYTERKYQQVKNTTNQMMEQSGLPAYTWLLALIYIYIYIYVCVCVCVVCPQSCSISGTGMEHSP